MIDLGRAERIAKTADARFYKPPPPIPQIYSKRRIAALSAYVQASGLPCEFPRKPVAHRDYPWIVCVPHAITPEGVVYADLQDTREVHRARVLEVPDDRYLRCQGFMAVTGAPLCDYVTVYQMSEEEARAERGQVSWGAHDKAWKQRKTFYHIHRIERDEEVIAHLLKQAFDIRERAGHGKEKRRPGADQVRAQFVPGRRPAGSARKTHRTRRTEQGQRVLSGRPGRRLGAAREARPGEGED